MDSRRSDLESSSGNPNRENLAEAAKSDALLEQIQKIDLTGIEDERARAVIRLLLNLVEDLRGDLKKAHQEIAYLRERLGLRQGGAGKPGDKSSPQPPRSSEKERNEPKERTKRVKLNEIKIDKELKLDLDRAKLPPDAQDKGYEEKVVQELRIATENVRFLRKKYYSASTGKTYLAPLPAGYCGEYGPNVRTLCVMFSHLCHMTERMVGVLGNLPWEQELSETELEGWLDRLMPELGVMARNHIVEAGAIAAYHAEVGHPVVRLLVCDDAKQFKRVTEELGLCWIHDGRHYKNLGPWLVYHR